jgi:hypothetical protein
MGLGKILGCENVISTVFIPRQDLKDRNWPLWSEVRSRARGGGVSFLLRCKVFRFFPYVCRSKDIKVSKEDRTKKRREGENKRDSRTWNEFYNLSVHTYDAPRWKLNPWGETEGQDGFVE